MYHRFKSRVTVSATLKAETALYIGAGQESFTPMAVQGSLLKNQREEPYIPGSSLKGVLRSFLESVQEESCERGQQCAEKYRTRELRDETRGELSEEQFTAQIYRESCPACRLFGSGIMAGKLKFADAALKQPEAWMGTELRTGNAIDRDTHTAAGGALFDTEAIPSGTEFSLRIVAENLSKGEAELFSELLQYFAEGGITVGGRSRAGLGMVSLAGIEVQVSYLEKGRFAPATKVMEGIAGLADFLVEKEAVYV
jgi:CRISPR-associated RAMP protein (TIGR02581 family)